MGKSESGKAAVLTPRTGVMVPNSQPDPKQRDCKNPALARIVRSLLGALSIKARKNKQQQQRCGEHHKQDVKYVLTQYPLHHPEIVTIRPPL
jgi:hypothetical protein